MLDDIDAEYKVIHCGECLAAGKLGGVGIVAPDPSIAPVSEVGDQETVTAAEIENRVLLSEPRLLQALEDVAVPLIDQTASLHVP